jgi:hypothetical protein
MIGDNPERYPVVFADLAVDTRKMHEDIFPGLIFPDKAEPSSGAVQSNGSLRHEVEAGG